MSDNSDKLSLEQINNTLDKKFSEKRTDWRKQVVDVIKRLNSIELERDEHVKIHMSMLILREDLVFESAAYKSKLATIKSIYRKQRKEKYQNFTTNFDIKLNSYNDKEVFISADLTQVIRQIEIMDNYMDFLKEQVMTCDKLGFSIKHIMDSN